MKKTRIPQLLLRAPDDVTVREKSIEEVKILTLFLRESPRGEDSNLENVQVFEWHPTDPAVLVAGLANGQLVTSVIQRPLPFSGTLGP